MDLTDKIEKITCEIDRLAHDVKTDTEITTAEWFSLNYSVTEVFPSIENIMSHVDEIERRTLRETYRALLDLERLTEERAFASLDTLSGVTRD